MLKNLVYQSSNKLKYKKGVNLAYKKTKKKKGKYTQIERLAYQIGQVEAGKKNSNSRVYESYCKGVENKKREKKPLF